MGAWAINHFGRAQLLKGETAMHRILLVDDEPRVLQALRRTLQSAGYEVATAASAVAAVEQLSARPIDLVISDYLMPDVNGIALFGQLRELWPDVTRVMLTGIGDTEVALRAIEEGAIFRYLAKPWPDDLLLKTVREALEHRARRLEARHLLDFMDRRHGQLDTVAAVVAAAKA